MQGYFSYKLIGTKKELEEAVVTVKNLAETNKDFRVLSLFSGEISKRIIEKGYYLEYCMGCSGNINGIPFEFDDMMSELSSLFENLEIEGTGYYLDMHPYPIWHSKKNDSSYDTKFEAVNYCLSLETDEYVNEDNVLIKNEAELCCPVCDEDVTLTLPDLIQEDDFFYFEEVECSCNCCDTDFLVEVYLE